MNFYVKNENLSNVPSELFLLRYIVEHILIRNNLIQLTNFNIICKTKFSPI